MQDDKLCNILAASQHSVCVSVCWSHSCAMLKRLNRSRCRLGADWGWPKEPCSTWSSDPPKGRGNFEGLPGPLKTIGCLCCDVRNKRDRSIVNNGTTYDAASCQNSLTACDCYYCYYYIHHSVNFLLKSKNFVTWCYSNYSSHLV